MFSFLILDFLMFLVTVSYEHTDANILKNKVCNTSSKLCVIKAFNNEMARIEQFLCVMLKNSNKFI